MLYVLLMKRVILMRIGVISDTHRYISSIDELGSKISELDVLIHLGDNVEDISIVKKYYKGKIINVNENWIEVETKKGIELINAEFVQSIKID